MVGTYYARRSRGPSPISRLAARVSAGQTVCIIEAMKIMNEIEAEFGGVIREVCVEDAAAGRIRPGPFPGGSQWLMPTAGGPSAAAPFNFKQAISQMVQRNGSDLHLKVGRPPDDPGQRRARRRSQCCRSARRT